MIKRINECIYLVDNKIYYQLGFFIYVIENDIVLYNSAGPDFLSNLVRCNFDKSFIKKYCFSSSIRFPDVNDILKYLYVHNDISKTSFELFPDKIKDYLLILMLEE